MSELDPDPNIGSGSGRNDIFMGEIKLLVLLSSGALQLSKFCLREPQLSDAARAPDNREITLRV